MLWTSRLSSTLLVLGVPVLVAVSDLVAGPSSTRVGSVINGDNVARDKVADPHGADPNVQGVRRFTELLAAEPHLQTTALQTVGGNGRNGFALALFTEAA